MKVANRILRPSKKSFQCTTLSAIIMRRLPRDRKSTRLNSSHGYISYAVFCLKKKKKKKLTVPQVDRRRIPRLENRGETSRTTTSAHSAQRDVVMHESRPCLGASTLLTESQA